MITNYIGRAHCKAKNCSTNRHTTKVSCFRFPIGNEQRCRLWVERCGNESLAGKSAQQLKNFSLCALHFERNAFRNENRNSLVHDAVPTIFDHDIVLAEWRKGQEHNEHLPCVQVAEAIATPLTQSEPGLLFSEPLSPTTSNASMVSQESEPFQCPPQEPDNVTESLVFTALDASSIISLESDPLQEPDDVAESLTSTTSNATRTMVSQEIEPAPRPRQEPDNDELKPRLFVDFSETSTKPNIIQNQRPKNIKSKMIQYKLVKSVEPTMTRPIELTSVKPTTHWLENEIRNRAPELALSLRARNFSYFQRRYPMLPAHQVTAIMEMYDDDVESALKFVEEIKKAAFGIR